MRKVEDPRKIELRSNLETLLTSDNTYLIPPGINQTTWYLDQMMGLIDGYVSLDDVTRLEIIDGTPCVRCGGSGKVMSRVGSDIDPEGNAGSVDCPACDGNGTPRCNRILWDPNKQIELSLQDDKLTAKIFISERVK